MSNNLEKAKAKLESLALDVKSGLLHLSNEELREFAAEMESEAEALGMLAED